MPADDRIDALYALPAAEFIAARDALVKALKAEGDKEGAAEAKALRRPTVAAWAVNQVARSSKKDVAALVQVGDRLRDAHDALLEGKGDTGVREATVERRKLVAKLTREAVALLGTGGDAQTEAITHTFDAAVADPEAGMVVRAGRLAKELEAPSGFGGGLIFGSSEPAAPRARREERRAARRSRQESTPVDEPAGTPAAPGDKDDIDVPIVEPPAPPAPPAPTAADRAEAKRAAAAAKAAIQEAERRRRELRREAEERATEAQLAAREAAAARQEVSRLQDELVTANARAKAAAEKAQLAQWKASTAQRALDDASDAE